MGSAISAPISQCEEGKIQLHNLKNVKDSQVSKMPAILMTVHRLEDRNNIQLVKWTQKWGYIIVDHKACVVLHGHGNMNRNINLPFVSNNQSTLNWKICEDEDHNLVFIVPDGSRVRNACFHAKDLETAMFENGSKILLDPTITYGSYPKILLRDSQLCIQGLNLQKSLNVSFDFYRHIKKNWWTRPFSFAHQQKNLQKLNLQRQLRLYTIISVCIVLKNDYWELVCGHEYGFYSMWKIPTGDLDIVHDDSDRVSFTKLYLPMSSKGLLEYKL